MFLAHALGKFEEEIKELYPHELSRWMAYFELRGERERDSAKRSQGKPIVRKGKGRR
jgi:predicted SprT family Zn-dependent metalloprotease